MYAPLSQLMHHHPHPHHQPLIISLTLSYLHSSSLCSLSFYLQIPFLYSQEVNDEKAEKISVSGQFTFLFMAFSSITISFRLESSKS